MNTVETITTITLAQITARMRQANERIKIAANNIVERHYQRGQTPVCPSDLAPLDMPAIPSLATHDGLYTSYRDASWIGYSHRGVGGDLSAAREASPVVLLGAIRSLDALAERCEAIAAAYRDATAAAIATHATAQTEAARELVGLVAGA